MHISGEGSKEMRQFRVGCALTGAFREVVISCDIFCIQVLFILVPTLVAHEDWMHICHVY